MLGVSSYPKTFVDGFRSRIEAQLATYDQLLTDVPGGEVLPAARRRVHRRDREALPAQLTALTALTAVAALMAPAAGPQVVSGLPSASQARLP
jgi:hypothetical protein